MTYKLPHLFPKNNLLPKKNHNCPHYLCYRSWKNIRYPKNVTMREENEAITCWLISVSGQGNVNIDRNKNGKRKIECLRKKHEIIYKNWLFNMRHYRQVDREIVLDIVRFFNGFFAQRQ